MTQTKASDGGIPSLEGVKPYGDLGIAAGREKDAHKNTYEAGLTFTKPFLHIGETEIPANCLIFTEGNERQTFCNGNMAGGWRIGTQITKVSKEGYITGYNCLVVFGGGEIVSVTPDELAYGGAF